MREVYFNFTNVQVVVFADGNFTDEELAEDVIENILLDMTDDNCFPDAAQCLAAH